MGDRSRLSVRGLFHTSSVGILLFARDHKIPNTMKEKLSTGDDVLKHLDLIEENAPPMVQLAAAAILLRDTNFPELIYKIIQGDVEGPCDKMGKAVHFALMAMERVMANHIKENSKVGVISIEIPEQKEKEDSTWKMPENYRN